MWKVFGGSNWSWKCDWAALLVRYALGGRTETNVHKFHDVVLWHCNQAGGIQKAKQDDPFRATAKQMNWSVQY